MSAGAAARGAVVTPRPRYLDRVTLAPPTPAALRAYAADPMPQYGRWAGHYDSWKRGPRANPVRAMRREWARARAGVAGGRASGRQWRKARKALQRTGRAAVRAGGQS